MIKIIFLALSMYDIVFSALAVDCYVIIIKYDSLNLMRVI